MKNEKGQLNEVKNKKGNKLYRYYFITTFRYKTKLFFILFLYLSCPNRNLLT